MQQPHRGKLTKRTFIYRSGIKQRGFVLNFLSYYVAQIRYRKSHCTTIRLSLKDGVSVLQSLNEATA